MAAAITEKASRALYSGNGPPVEKGLFTVQAQPPLSRVTICASCFSQISARKATQQQGGQRWVPHNSMPSAEILKSILLAMAFMVYLLVGALVFQVLEKEAEDTAKTDTERHRLDFLKNYTCLTKEALDHLVNVITDAVKQGIHPLENQTKNSHSNWDMSSSFFFAGTVVTTIGYGTLSPRTPGGQIFCVLYALFGIPLNVIVLGRVGKILSRVCHRLGQYFFNKGMKPKKAKVLTIIFFSVTGIIVFLGLPPLLFTKTEKWTYTEGVYYAFISLSTIGFGDYVVGYGPQHFMPFRGFRALVCLWIIFGLSWLSLLFNLLTSLLEDTEKKIAKDIQKKVKSKKDSEQIALEPLTSSYLSESEKTVDSNNCNIPGEQSGKMANYDF
eukprot:XP_017951913.1 PREDICTED: potassium channel subfamily K member 16-like [Xenopus tropicalis]